MGIALFTGNFNDVFLIYYFIGHSIIFDIFLVYASFKLRLCLWHKILSFNLLLIILIEWINVKFNIYFIDVFYVNFFFCTTIAGLIYTLIWKIRHDYKKSRIKQINIGTESNT